MAAAELARHPGQARRMAQPSAFIFRQVLLVAARTALGARLLPVSGIPVKRGTLASILRQAGFAPDEFLKLLDRIWQRWPTQRAARLGHTPHQLSAASGIDRVNGHLPRDGASAALDTDLPRQDLGTYQEDGRGASS